MDRWHGPSASAWIIIQENVAFLLSRERDMTAQQSEFDQAFTDLSSAVGTLITDFTNLNTRIQSLPPSEPTPAQLQEIKDLSAKVHASLPAEAPVSPPASVSPVVDAPPLTPPLTPPPTPPTTPPTTPPVAAPVTPPADAPGTVTPQAL